MSIFERQPLDHAPRISSKARDRSFSGVWIESAAKWMVPFCVIACVFAAVSVVVTVMSEQKAEIREQAWQMAFENLQARQRDTDTSAKLLERRYMDMVAYFEVNGLAVPGDSEHGPTGNYKRMVQKEDKHGRK